MAKHAGGSRARQGPGLAWVRGKMGLLPAALTDSVFIFVWARLRKGTESIFKRPIGIAGGELFPVMPVTHLPPRCIL